MKHDTAIIIMAKQPQVGRVKTRLSPPLTPEQAAALSEALLCDTVALVSGLAGIDGAIAITPAGARPYFEGISPPGTRLIPVEGPDIGACLAQALQALLQAGYRKAVALNADGPSLPPAYLLQATAALDKHDVVLGPSDDGGYYLIGLKEMATGLFEGIRWSSTQVLRQTLERAIRLGYHTWLGPLWYDVDGLADLQRLQGELAQQPPGWLPFTRRCLTGFTFPHASREEQT